MTTQPKKTIDKTRGRRKTRSDKGTRLLTDRDLLTLRWIADQQAATIDHIQILLSRMPGRNATDKDAVGEGAARSVVARWLDAGWVERERTLVKGKTWVWLTAKGLTKLQLPFRAHRPAESTRKHLDAVNTVRLDAEANLPEATWISERHLRAGITRRKHQKLAHMPDAVLLFPDNSKVAIEVELTMKRLDELKAIMMELASQLAEADESKDSSQEDAPNHDDSTKSNQTSTHWPQPQTGVQMLHSYEEIWYYAPPTLAKHLAVFRDLLVKRGDLTEDEAEAFSLFSYPPVPEEDSL